MLFRQTIAKTLLIAPKIQTNSVTYLVQVILATLRVVDGGLVTVVSQVTGSHQAVAAIVPRAASHQDSVALVQGMHAVDDLGDGEPG